MRILQIKLNLLSASNPLSWFDNKPRVLEQLEQQLRRDALWWFVVELVRGRCVVSLCQHQQQQRLGQCERDLGLSRGALS